MQFYFGFWISVFFIQHLTVPVSIMLHAASRWLQ
uniref:Uncharacterized protein n=1 Tax=Anguilla anguilla TaxID=7936 RepID=A0A0E9S9J4_ANGAN